MFKAAENRRWAMAVYLVCLTLQAVSFGAYAAGFDTYALYAQYATFVLLLVVYRPKSLLHAMWLMSHLNLFVLPSFAMLTVLGPVNGWLSTIVGLSTVLVFFFGARVELHPSRLPQDVGYLYGFLFACLATAIALTIPGVARGTDVFPILLSLLLVSLRRLGPSVGAVAVGACFAVFVYWAAFLWSGFGRLNVAQWTMIAILLYVLLYNVRIDTRLVVLTSSMGPSLLGYVRGGRSVRDQFASGQIDSNVSPLLFAEGYVAPTSYVIDLYGWLDQVFLFFFIWIPRRILTSKPLGFGREYVVQEMDDSFVASGHSIAGMFAGEHLYYLGPMWGALGTIGSAVLVVYLCVRFRSQQGGMTIVTMLMVMQIPTFFWGGMAAASARFFVGGVVILLTMVLWRILMLWRTARASRRRTW